MGFEGLAGCVHEQKRYQKHIKTNIKIHPQMDENQCRIDARNSDALKHRKSSNMEQKIPKTSTKLSETCRET